MTIPVISKVVRGDISWARVSKRLEMLIMMFVQPRRSFTLGGEKYSYCAGGYNSAWHNERTVEIAIALHHLRRHRDSRVLEIGNVLSYYTTVRHDVVDKYEVAPGVVNADVMDYDATEPYDLIVSVSTLEHVGWDEDIDDWTKPVRAVTHLVGLLGPDGTLVVTLPVGYNPHVDKALRDGLFDFDQVRYLKRVSRDNRWQEADKADVGVVRYGRPFPAANVVAVGLRRASARPDGGSGGRRTSPFT